MHSARRTTRAPPRRRSRSWPSSRSRTRRRRSRRRAPGGAARRRTHAARLAPPRRSSPRSRHTAAAAIALSRLWRPRRRTSEASISGSSRHSRRPAVEAASRSRVPRRTGSRGRRCPPSASFTTATSDGCRFAKMRSFASRYSAVDAWRSRWSGGEVQEHGRLRREGRSSPRAGSSTPRRRPSRPGRARPPASSPACRRCRPRPPGRRRRGASRRSARPWSSCRSCPVTAMNSFGTSRQPSSSSPRTSMPALRARADHGRVPRDARALDDRCGRRRCLQKVDAICIQMNFDACLRKPFPLRAAPPEGAPRRRRPPARPAPRPAARARRRPRSARALRPGRARAEAAAAHAPMLCW